MLRVLRDKIKSLVYDDEGVAFVVTLAVFFFLYLMCAGVYAIGTAIKERIHLQNACDAAAYSAAVVQADTLSRIATINRAMSWTYVQMTRRQMDYIVYKWLDHSCAHFNQDRAIAEGWHSGSPRNCPMGHGLQPEGWFIGSKRYSGKFNAMWLNEHHDADEDDVWASCRKFNNTYMNQGVIRDSFYAFQEGKSINVEKLKAQINADKETILKMNDAEKEVAQKLEKTEMEKIVEEVLKANIPDLGANLVDKEYKVFMADKPDSYLTILKDEDELRFVNFSAQPEKTGNIEKVFETGINKWFELEKLDEGIRRRYKQYFNSLQSDWWWWSGHWRCYKDNNGVWHHPVRYYTQGCPHKNCNDTCSRSGGHWYHARLKASYLHDSYYDGVAAKPHVLTKEYFGENGTITVGIACENKNPWESLVGGSAARNGIFSAFFPFVKKTVVFASAKAGYKQLNEKPPYLDNGSHANRGYRIDWKDGAWNSKEQSWNLCQSDWDAVLMPVRMAKAQAAGGQWIDAKLDFLSEWVGQLVDDGEMLSGGTRKIYYDSEVKPYKQAWHELKGGSPQHLQGEAVNAEWQIGKPHKPPQWDKLTNRMFH